MTSSQHTIKHVVSCIGVGVHSGKTTALSVYPATANSGILFIRTDLSGKESGSKANRVYARYNAVNKTRLGTTICNEFGVEIATVEHLMAAFAGCNIDNAIVELDGPEIPIMDGSAWPFVCMLECAGARAQEAPRKYLEVLKEVFVQDGESTIRIRPGKSFEASARIEFDNAVIASQTCSFSSGKSFKTELSKARTFGFKHEAVALKKVGLARGASLENVVVIDDNGILNEDGLRYPNEFARHKLLDLIGDFYLIGSPIRGEISAFKPGHAINNKAIHALLSDADAYRFVEV